MARRFKHLTKADRIKIEALTKAGHKPREIANAIGVHKSTVYRELKRGVYVALKTDLTEEKRYSPDIAHDKYREHLKNKGPGLKIGNDKELADYIEKKILDDDYSPDAVIGELNAQNGWERFKSRICTSTLYSYISKNIFLNITNKNLPVKGKRKREYKKVERKTQSRDSSGESIEKRPEGINDRKEFGHWEMDTVIGKRGISKNSLLVLTERKTRNEIVMKLSRHTSSEVVEKINGLEEKYGALFPKIFKTITVDNGTEFCFCDELEKSNTEGKRTKMYYCHPYSSWERGSNENQNKMIRRKIPKGVNFDETTDAEIQALEDWMNNYPRKILKYRSAGELFKEELEAIKLDTGAA